MSPSHAMGSPGQQSHRLPRARGSPGQQHYVTPDTSLNRRSGIAIRIRYGDTPIRRRYGIGEVLGK